MAEGRLYYVVGAAGGGRELYISSDGPLETAGEELLAAVAGNRN
jgi:hypothetical protein